MLKVVTIGVYGYSASDFFGALQRSGVQLLCDIRWRRGVRGADYAFANHQRLLARLEDLGVGYLHCRDLAPTPEIRQRQKDADHARKVAKRQRGTLSQDFIEAYRELVLADFDPQDFVTGLPQGITVVALLCVERQPEACHRSLVAEKLSALGGVEVVHLLPP